MTNWTLQTLPNHGLTRDEISHVDETVLASLVEKSVNQIIFLEKKIESATQNETIATALHRQKQIINQLRETAAKGYAYGGLGVMQAAIITGDGMNRFFDYLCSYTDTRGCGKIAQFIQLPRLILTMQHYNTMQKADDLSGFISGLPDLKRLRFSATLFDALNEPSRRTNMPFQQELFRQIITDASLKSDNPIERRFQVRAQNILGSAAQKAYPYALLTYADILNRQGKDKEAQEMLCQIKFNKFASDSLKKEAQRLTGRPKLMTGLNRLQGNVYAS